MPPQALVEGIDLIPTFIEVLGGDPHQPWLEGRSFLDILHGRDAESRDFVVAELDYFARKARLELKVAADRAKGWMVRSERWKYVFYEGFELFSCLTLKVIQMSWSIGPQIRHARGSSMSIGIVFSTGSGVGNPRSLLITTISIPAMNLRPGAGLYSGSGRIKPSPDGISSVKPVVLKAMEGSR